MASREKLTVLLVVLALIVGCLAVFTNNGASVANVTTEVEVTSNIDYVVTKFDIPKNKCMDIVAHELFDVFYGRLCYYPKHLASPVPVIKNAETGEILKLWRPEDGELHQLDFGDRPFVVSSFDDEGILLEYRTVVD